ncbi:MAG: sulfite exporter TauE/SafE family protein [Clostridium sp.]|nr:sulfite exporter TauE/SafE family protein [Clostridium sp.]
MVTAVYGIIILLACTIGALSGIGGGVIIKPVLDFFGFHTVEIVGFIATCSVFAMSVSSSIKQIRAKTKINPKIVLLIAIGSIVGSIIGNTIFDTIFDKFNSDIVKGIQSIILALFLVFVIIYINKKNAKSWKLTNPVLIIFSGLFLGLISAFLGIGGGPINMAFLVMLFSFSVKESTVYSIAIIIFSKMSQLITIFINNQFKPYLEYYPIIIVAIVAALLGGVIGAKLNKKLSNKTITKALSSVLFIIIVINVYNAITGFISK